MKKAVLPLAVLAMLGLIGAAVAWDCVRLAADARHRVELADEELQKHEQRLVTLLTGSPRLSREVHDAVNAHQETSGPQARHAAYDKLVASFRQTMSESIDPTNPLDRRFMDDIAGAINRREVAQKPYDNEVAEYHQFLQGHRGNVARWFSSQTRADWKTGD